MSFEVYKADLSNRHEITHAIAVQMVRYYNGIGKLMLVVSADEYNIKSLEVGGLLYDTDSGATYTIQEVEYDTPQNRVTANGFTANWILNKRAVKTAINTQNVEEAVMEAVTQNLRGLPNVEVATASGLTATRQGETIYGGQVIDTIIPVLDAAGYGHKLVWDPDEMIHVFHVYEGADRTSGIHGVTFSEDMGTAADLVITDDNSVFANVIYAQVSYRDDTDGIIEYGNATGGNRYEKWLNSIRMQKSDETRDEFEARVKADCAAEAEDRVRRQTFTVNVDGSEIGTYYNLGDKVNCVSSKFGMAFEARITGVKYTLDLSGRATQLILGEPKLTALGEMRLS